ncbi:unnamed protein product, partial [Rotaria magnacalcarata]
RVGRPLSQS